MTTQISNSAAAASSAQQAHAATAHGLSQKRKAAETLDSQAEDRNTLPQQQQAFNADNITTAALIASIEQGATKNLAQQVNDFAASSGTTSNNTALTNGTFATTSDNVTNKILSQQKQAAAATESGALGEGVLGMIGGLAGVGTLGFGRFGKFGLDPNSAQSLAQVVSTGFSGAGTSTNGSYSGTAGKDTANATAEQTVAGQVAAASSKIEEAYGASTQQLLGEIAKFLDVPSTALNVNG